MYSGHLSREEAQRLPRCHVSWLSSLRLLAKKLRSVVPVFYLATHGADCGEFGGGGSGVDLCLTDNSPGLVGCCRVTRRTRLFARKGLMG